MPLRDAGDGGSRISTRSTSGRASRTSMSSSMAMSSRPQAAARSAARAVSTSQSATIRASGLARYSMACRSEMRPVPTMPTPMGQLCIARQLPSRQRVGTPATRGRPAAPIRCESRRISRRRATHAAVRVERRPLRRVHGSPSISELVAKPNLGACVAERFWAPSDTICSGRERSDTAIYGSQFFYCAGS